VDRELEDDEPLDPDEVDAVVRCASIKPPSNSACSSKDSDGVRARK
jgi:hypothetical protein